MLYKLSIILQLIGFVGGGLMVSFLSGTIFVRFLGKKASICAAIVNGFLLCIALYQLIAIPFILNNGSLSKLTLLYIGILLFLCIYGGKLLYQKKVQFCPVRFSLTKIVVIAIVILQAFFASYLYSVESDDSYYVSISTYAYEQDTICLDQTEITTGMEYVSATSRPLISAWEVFLATCSLLIRVKPIILIHSFMPLLAIFIMYCGFYQIGDFLENNENRDWFVLFASLLILFSGYSTANMGSFILMRAWQGKSVFAAIVLPALFANCCRLISDDKKNWLFWLHNAIILLAGVGCTVVGLFLGALLYLMIALAYMSVSKWKEIRSLIIPAIASVVPVAILAVYSLRSVDSGIMQNYIAETPATWESVFNEYWNTPSWNGICIIICFFISLIFLYKHSTRPAKIVFGLSSIFTVTILLNPLLQKVIAQRITGVDVYWRLYWLLPVYVTIPYMMVELKDNCFHIKRQWIIGGIFCLAIAFCGKNVFQRNAYFKPHKSLHRIPVELVEVSDYILSKDSECAVLVPEEFSEQLRQYTSVLLTPYARGYYNGTRELESRRETLQDFYNSIYHGTLRNPDVIYRTLKELQVEYIVFPQSLKLRKNDYIIEMDTIDGYIIYKVAGY